MRTRALSIAAASLLTAACTGSATNVESPMPSQTASSTASASPAQSLPTADCPGLTDNTTSPTPAVADGETVYYMFGCHDERLLVQVTAGEDTGGVVFLPLQSEYSYGQITFDASGIHVTKTITSLDKVLDVPLPFYGSPTDLRIASMVRIVGPTADVTDFDAQDCADYLSMGAKDCATIDYSSATFLRQGADAGWVQEFSS